MEIRILSDMAKVFEKEIPARYQVQTAFTVLQGEQLCFQVAYRSVTNGVKSVRFRVEGISKIQMWTVEQVPVTQPVGDHWDEDYLSTTAGLYPDCLMPLPEDGSCRASENWQSVLVCSDEVVPGEHAVQIRCETVTGEAIGTASVMVYSAPVALPAQTLKYTRWFHCDAIADVYGVEVFSEAHWNAIRQYMIAAREQGMNMILTPIHTPPLDTAIGAERKTVQLVDITIQEGQYTFAFDKLDRWIQLALAVGIEYFEMAHLFTQWGAMAASKITAVVDGKLQRIFGWDTASTGKEYAAFLKAYLSSLTQHLRNLGIAERCIFHISDEPTKQDKGQYRAARLLVEPYLKDFVIMDALSDVEFFEEGIITHPIPSNDHIEPFLQKDWHDRWTYYCCGQTEKVSNSLIAMPGERTRILGVQLYRESIQGFLQWGLNFYYDGLSRMRINPFLTTDGHQSWPAGDPFNLYPGPGGKTLPSLRAVLMRKAMDDMRALQLLEKMTDRTFVEKLIDEEAGERVSFSSYPQNEAYILKLRRRIYEQVSG